MFFKNQPNIYYPSKNGIKISKNLFRRVRFRDNTNSIYLNSNVYTIQEGETPEIVANKLYKSPQWYWTILLLNNIIDVNSDWPMNSFQLDSFIEKKYGSNADKPRHWVTQQIKLPSGRVILKADVIIEVYQNLPTQNVPGYIPSYDFKHDGVSYPNTQTVKEITNREYEYSLNENKRTIYVIKKQFLTKLEKEFKNLIEYDTNYKISESGIRYTE